jgi:hypothetical protein
MISYYLHPGLSTGLNDGTSEANAFQSWAACVAHINANNPDFVAAEQAVKVWLLGSVTPHTVGLILTAKSSPAYPLIIEVPESLRSPGVFNSNAPGFSVEGGMLRFSPADGWAQIGLHVIGVQITGPANRFMEITDATPVGGYVLFRNNYVKDRYNTTTADYACVLNWTGTGVNKELVSQNNIYENFYSTYLPDLDRFARCQAFRMTGANTSFSSANDTYINLDNRAVQTDHSNNSSFVNCVFIDTARADSTSPRMTASLSGFNITNLSESDQGVLWAGVNTLYDIDPSVLFVSATDRRLKQPNGYGIGPDNADTVRAAFVPQYDLLGVERTGTTTDVGAHLFDGVIAPPARKKVKPWTKFKGNLSPSMSGSGSTAVGGTPTWSLPDTIEVIRGHFVDVRQYAVNATGLPLNVTGLVAGLSYDAENERIVSDGSPAPYWELPATVEIEEGGTLGIRQFAREAEGRVLNVTGLPEGVTYNSELERLEAD